MKDVLYLEISLIFSNSLPEKDWLTIFEVSTANVLS